MTDLGSFLLLRLARPRQTGEWDCCTFPAEWAMENGHADPMAQYRGAYGTEAEAEDIIARAGGLAALFGAGLGGIGCARVDEPQAGDLGVICLRGEEAGAVFAGQRWAFVAERGLGFATLDLAAVPNMWRLPGHG